MTTSRRFPGTEPLRAAASDADSARFEVAYRRHYRDLVRIAERVTREPAASEEVVQTVFENVFARWSELKDLPWLEPYLRRAVLNGSLMHLRRVRREQFRQGLERAWSCAEIGDGLERSELVAEVRQAIRRLPARQQQCLEARFSGRPCGGIRRRPLRHLYRHRPNAHAARSCERATPPDATARIAFPCAFDKVIDLGRLFVG